MAAAEREQVTAIAARQRAASHTSCSSSSLKVCRVCLKRAGEGSGRREEVAHPLGATAQTSLSTKGFGESQWWQLYHGSCSWKQCAPNRLLHFNTLQIAHLKRQACKEILICDLSSTWPCKTDANGKARHCCNVQMATSCVHRRPGRGYNSFQVVLGHDEAGTGEKPGDGQSVRLLACRGGTPKLPHYCTHMTVVRTSAYSAWVAQLAARTCPVPPACA